MWVLRWPVVLVLLGYVVVCVAAAAGLTADKLGLALDHEIWSAFAASASGAGWIETALWAGAGVMLFISAVRLVRRTQGFWAWLLGFAAYGARWALSETGGDFVAEASAVRSLDDAAPVAANVVSNYPLVLLFALLVVGLLILVIDGADKRWARRGA